MRSGQEAWQSLTQSFRTAWPTSAAANVGVVVGCSGGADSVALVRLVVDFLRGEVTEVRKRQPPLVIAHFNHHLRGEQSDADEHFVRELAASLHVDVEVGRPSRSALMDDEAGLRADRREFFLSTAARSGCRYVAVAHTADDQAETILHQLFRGTGTSGLIGMQPAAPLGNDFVLLRPVLQTRRDDLRAGLHEIGQTWREDASNQSTRYTRNWIRHEILPRVRERFPQVDPAIMRAGENQSQLHQMCHRLARQWVEAFVCLPTLDVNPSTQSPFLGRLTIRRPTIANTPPTLGPEHAWPHAGHLANEPTVIIAACQFVFDTLRWPRGGMSQQHWIRLANAIATTGDTGTGSDAKSLGHWPGHLETIQSDETVVLRYADRV